MALFNYTTKEITMKVVYYGPGLSGKTTNLQYLHHTMNSGTKGKLVSLPTESDRTLFFDLLPINLGKIRDFSLRFQLYTVPGQVRYNATRKLVLKGADAIVFVADSQREMREQNMESFKNMRENLIANNINPDEISLILQYNKRDLPNILPIEELNKDLNENSKHKYIEAIAIDGTGIEDTFQDITKMSVEEIKHKIDFPQSKKTVKEPSLEEAQIKAEIVEATLEKPVTPIPELQPTMYETEREHKPHNAQQMQKEPKPVVTEKMPPSSREAIIKKVELPPALTEKLGVMNKNITDIMQMFKELSRVMKEIDEEQKVINAQLKDIRKTFETMKSKKRWFWFS